MDRSADQEIEEPACNAASIRKAKRKACPWKYEPIPLRPCKVCGERATGYHFGVISCEACKSFYRRSLKRSRPYLCEKGGTCPTDSRGTTTCPACRLKKCVDMGMSPDAVKKGRYSYEKRAETIIQSRTYWHGKVEEPEPEPCEYVESECGDTNSFIEPSTAAAMLTKDKINAESICEDFIATGLTFTEAIPDQSAASHNSLLSNDNTSRSQKSLREILGIADTRKPYLSVNEKHVSENQTEVITGPSQDNQTQYQTVSTSEKAQTFSNLQPVVYTLSNQSINQTVKSPESMSDDSGVFLMSPGNLSYVNSVPPVSPYMTFTINEPETQAQITEVIPGKVRSINMRRELVIDGTPISYLLEGVLVPPRDPTPEPNPNQSAAAITCTSTTNSQMNTSFAEDLSIDGHPISSMLANILEDLQKESENQNMTPLPILTPQVPHNLRSFDNNVNSLLIDGKPIFQTFELFSRKNKPSVGNITCKSHSVSPNGEVVNPATLAEENLGMATADSTSYSEQSPNSQQTDIAETARTLLHMASMQLPTSPSELCSEGTAQLGVDPNIRNPSAASESVSEIEKLLREDMSATNDEEIRDLDALITKTGEFFERNQFATTQLIARLPEMEREFLEKRRKKEEMFGKMGFVSKEDYLEIFRETGIDVDGRSERLQHTITSLEHVVKKLAVLYKGILGFQSLPIEDQISVLKETHHDIGFFMHRQLYNCRERLITSPFLQQTIDESYFLSVMSQDTVDMMFEIAERIQKLNFTDLEVSLIVAVLIMQPDACKTEVGKKKCAQHKKLSIKAFHRALSRERTDDQVLYMFRETMDLFKDVLTYKTKIDRHCSNFFVDYSHLSFPKLVTEVYGKD